MDITVFLILGALLAGGVAELYLDPSRSATCRPDQPYPGDPAMMGLAVLLCLCSEADAFVAASFITLHAVGQAGVPGARPDARPQALRMYTRVFPPAADPDHRRRVIVQVFLYTIAVHYFWDTYAERLGPISPKLITKASISEAELQKSMGRTVWGVGQFGARRWGGTGWASFAAAGRDDRQPDDPRQDVSFLELENAARNGGPPDFDTWGAHPHLRRFLRRRAALPVAARQDQLLRRRRHSAGRHSPPDNSKLPEGATEPPAKQLQDKWVQAIGRVEFYAMPTGAWKVAIIVTPKK